MEKSKTPQGSDKSYHEYATEVNIFVQEYNTFWKGIKETVIQIFFR
ncbi:MAG: hypothetical protein AAF518_13860 [Spirochaetota bacterium]